VKTGHLIYVKRSHPTNEEEFIRRLVRKETLVSPALAILNEVRTGEFNKHNYIDNAKRLGLTLGQFYWLLQTLRALGLIRREEGEYKPSAQFALRLLRYVEYAEKLTGVKVARYE